MSSTRNSGRTVRWRGESAGSVPESCRTPFQRLFTPYHRTPASRRLGLSAARLRRRSNEIENVDLKDLVGKTWKIYKATPLYGFSYQAATLRRYARMLSASIEAELRKGVVIDASEVPDVAEIEIYKGLDVNPRDHKAVQITLKTRSKRDGSRESILVALLASVDVDEAVTHSVPTAFTPLPLVLVRGPVMLARLLTGWLEVQFDCSISPLVIPSVNLHWMVAMWAGDVPERRPKSVELSYVPPPEVDKLSRITLTLNPEDCKALWDCIHSGGDRFLETEVVMFIKALEAHFHHHFGIYLNAMHLQRIGTALAYVSSEGKIKMFAEEHILKILASLTELACEQVLI